MAKFKEDSKASFVNRSDRYKNGTDLSATTSKMSTGQASFNRKESAATPAKKTNVAGAYKNIPVKDTKTNKAPVSGNKFNNSKDRIKNDTDIKSGYSSHDRYEKPARNNNDVKSAESFQNRGLSGSENKFSDNKYTKVAVSRQADRFKDTEAEKLSTVNDSGKFRGPEPKGPEYKSPETDKFIKKDKVKLDKKSAVVFVTKTDKHGETSAKAKIKQGVVRSTLEAANLIKETADTFKNDDEEHKNDPRAIKAAATAATIIAAKDKEKAKKFRKVAKDRFAKRDVVKAEMRTLSDVDSRLQTKAEHDNAEITKPANNSKDEAVIASVMDKKDVKKTEKNNLLTGSTDNRLKGASEVKATDGEEKNSARNIVATGIGTNEKVEQIFDVPDKKLASAKSVNDKRFGTNNRFESESHDKRFDKKKQKGILRSAGKGIPVEDNRRLATDSVNDYTKHAMDVALIDGKKLTPEQKALLEREQKRYFKKHGNKSKLDYAVKYNKIDRRTAYRQYDLEGRSAKLKGDKKARRAAAAKAIGNSLTLYADYIGTNKDSGSGNINDSMLAYGMQGAPQLVANGIKAKITAKIRAMAAKLAVTVGKATVKLAIVAMPVLLPLIAILLLFMVTNASHDASAGTFDNHAITVDTIGDGKTFNYLSQDMIDNIWLNLLGPYDDGTYGEPEGQTHEVVDEYPESDLNEHPEVMSAISYVMSKVGCTYSQAYHGVTNEVENPDKFDCSSLVYRAYKNSGVDISYGGAYTAAYECRQVDENGQGVENGVDSLRPGDLLFYGNADNGRYRGIYHVAMYVGKIDGVDKMIEAYGTDEGVIYTDVRQNDLVQIGRPVSW